MPRKTPASPVRKRTRKVATVPTLAEATAAAIAALPFAPDREPTDPRGFFALAAPDGADYDGDAIRVQIAAQIAKDRAAGLSGNDLRAKYAGPSEAHAKGRGLTGPIRRRVLREYGHGSVIARSYDAYRDGAARAGSAHAREHGPLAAARTEARLDALAREATDALDAKAIRAALRAAGRKAPTVRGGDESALRAAHVALLREADAA
jgi:hypothetical protein